MFCILTSRRMLRIPRKPKKEELNGKDFLLLSGIIAVGFPLSFVLAGKWLNFVFSIFD
jgi:hypothetical protein